MSLSDDKRDALSGHPSINLFKRRASGIDRARTVARKVARHARGSGSGSSLGEADERSLRQSVELFLRGQMIVEMHLCCLASHIAKLDDDGLDRVDTILAEEAERLHDGLSTEARELVRATTWFREWVERLERRGSNESLRDELEAVFEFAALLVRKGLDKQGTAPEEERQ